MIQIPTWGTFAEWQEANQTLDYLLKRYKNEFSRAFQLAREIQTSLEVIFPIQDEICRATCACCPDPCCLNATVWIDFKDLLFLHLTNQKIPEHQLIEKQGDSCGYHLSTGCKLPRLSRPWTCTLYLCPSQKLIFRLLPESQRRDYEQRVDFIKQSRTKLEDLFIDIIA